MRKTQPLGCLILLVAAVDLGGVGHLKPLVALAAALGASLRGGGGSLGGL